MKVAVFADGFPKISETFISDFIRGLKQAGIHVDLLPRHIADEWLLEGENRDADLAGDVIRPTVISSLAQGQRLGTLLDLLQAFARYPAATIRVMRVAEEVPLHSRSCFPFAIRPLLEGGHDLLHAHFGHTALRALAMKETLRC